MIAIKIKLIPMLLSFLLLMFTVAYSSVVFASDVVLIANKANTLDTLKQNQLVRIYLRKTKQFANGSEVIPIDLKAGDTRDVFYRDVVRKSERQLKYYWSRMMFSGNTRPPKKLRSDRAVIHFVANHVNALGYVRADSVTDDVKVISVLDE